MFPQAEKPAPYASPYKEGAVVTGTVTRVLPSAVFVDVGDGAAVGKVPVKDISIVRIDNLEAVLPKGTKIKVLKQRTDSTPADSLAVHLVCSLALCMPAVTSAITSSWLRHTLFPGRNIRSESMWLVCLHCISHARSCSIGHKLSPT